jgi:hypothetical protein
MIDTKLVQDLLASARAVTPLTALRAASFDLDRQSHEAAHIVRAQVTARLPDGTFRVVVDNTAHRMALPPEVRPGDVVELRVLPRSPERALSRPAAAATTETLSSAGQVLARVLAQPRGEPPRQSEPVLPMPPSKPEELHAPLARAVERSGVFYESHQARWVEGEYPLQRLLQEPQAALRPRAVTRIEPAAAGPAENAAVQERLPLPEKPAGALPAPVPATQAEAFERPALEATPLASASPSMQEPAEADAPSVPNEALSLVRQQLDTLETRQLTWLGEIWPGQTMRWDIGEDAGRAPDDAEPGQWRSRFEVSLPSLGSVTAEMQLIGSQLRLRLLAQDPATAARMRSAASELAEALQASGLRLCACDVECHESAR